MERKKEIQAMADRMKRKPRVKNNAIDRVDRKSEYSREWHSCCPKCNEFFKPKSYSPNMHEEICPHCNYELVYYDCARSLRDGKWVYTRNDNADQVPEEIKDKHENEYKVTAYFDGNDPDKVNVETELSKLNRTKSVENDDFFNKILCLNGFVMSTNGPNEKEVEEEFQKAIINKKLNQLTSRELSSINLILKELQGAKKQHPEWPTDLIHQSAIVAEEAGELTRASLNCIYKNESIEDCESEAIQVGAMAIRFLSNI